MTMDIDNVLFAIAEPTRRKILELIGSGEVSSGEIASRLYITRPGVSQHLKILVKAGVLNVRPEGTHRLYRVRPEGLRNLKRFLEHFLDQSECDDLKQMS